FLTGYFTEEVVGLGTSGALTFSGIGVDTIDSAITSYFNINANDFTFAQTSIAMSSVSVSGNGGFTGTVDNFDMVNKADTPEPTALFGLGVIAAGLVTSRRQKNS
ncbi:MAG: PEP-CTERM sorting domain-containing protein, partial [Okeania sp. SIO3B5]|uniref:PEP-CTERM sorting domain-containing protein n=1 Tax=Okeania sp. SIO3B5 TaxID=2607811 RepID=UPI0013FFE2F0